MHLIAKTRLDLNWSGILSMEVYPDHPELEMRKKWLSREILSSLSLLKVYETSSEIALNWSENPVRTKGERG